MEKFCEAELWNYNLTWNTNYPDFTNCFKNTVLIWVPCIFLWVFSSVDIYYMYHSKNRNIPWSVLNISKLCITTIIILLTLVDFMFLLFNFGKEHSLTFVGVATHFFEVLTLSLSVFLLVYNKKYGVRSSGSLFTYWFLMVICGIPQLRTHLQRDSTSSLFPTTTYIIYYLLVMIMFILNFFVDGAPRKTKYPRSEKSWPEDQHSFPSRVTFMWLNSLIWNGYKHPLEKSDLWELRPEETAKKIVPVFEKHWKKALKKSEGYCNVTLTGIPEEATLLNSRNEKSGKHVSVVPILIKTFWASFISGSVFKLVFDCFLFVNPHILKLILSFIQNDEEQWKGYFYAGLLLVSSTVQTLILAQYFNRTFICGMRIRTVLISLIYRKSLRISNVVKKSVSTGEIVNLMAIDAQKFAELISVLNLLWSAPFQIIVALVFLWRFLGFSVMAGLATMIFLIPINTCIANKIKILQGIQMKYKDERIKLMNEILGGIKVLKMYAWEQGFQDAIRKIRDEEVKVLKRISILNAVSTFIWSCAPFWVTLFSFGTFVLVDEKNKLTPEITFVSLSLFNIIQYPLESFPLLISQITRAAVSIKRINNFLNSPELNPGDVGHDSNEKSAVLIEDGDFDWYDGPILRDINVKIQRGELVAIVGNVGSGKSSLISAILGEMNKTKGRVNVIGKLAYVPQQAWILNLTLRDNILFGKSFNEQLYNKVIKCCELSSDIDILPAKDNTEIGEKGINLSGGQKQRVSVARAVYSDADVYLLDDPLSAVDSHVGKSMFENVIGRDGLLKGKTRILVTHSVTFLSDVDKIVVVKDGRISEIGTYEELLNSKRDFAEFLMQHKTEKNDLNNEGNEYFTSDICETLNDSQKLSGSCNKLQETSKEKPKNLENIATGTVKWSVYKHYFKSVGVFATLCTLIMYAIFQCLNVGSNYWLSLWSGDKRFFNDTVKEDMYLLIYGSLGFAQAITAFLSSITLYLGALNGARLLHTILLYNVMRASCNFFFDITPIGRILDRFSRDIDVIDTVLPENIRSFLTTLLSVLGTLFVISYVSPAFVIVAVVLGAVYFFVQRLYIVSSRQLKRLQSTFRAPIYSHFSESLAGTSSIRAYVAQEKFIRDNEHLVYENLVCHYPNIMANRWLAVRLEMIGNVAIFFAALFAVIDKNKEAGAVGLSIVYAFQITQCLNWLVRTMCDLETNIVNVERIKEYDNIPKEASWEIPEKFPGAIWPKHGEIIFNKCSARYRADLNYVFQNLSFSIEAKDKIGVVGRTGAGKSSLTLVLFRIMELAEGEIKIDNINIADMGLHDLRSRLTVIPQDPVLFSGTLRMNLDPLIKFSDEEIWKSLENAHLKSFVKDLKDGLYHEIQEEGENLSVGQRQLICLCRALLRKTKVLILDEATAAVDLDTDDFIQKTIKNEFSDSTIITIAHRLNTVMDSDKILVLDKGTIAEFDTPQALLSDEKSIFYGMVKDAGLI